MCQFSYLPSHCDEAIILSLGLTALKLYRYLLCEKICPTLFTTMIELKVSKCGPKCKGWNAAHIRSA